jgi:hypothetical protein
VDESWNNPTPAIRNFTALVMAIERTERRAGQKGDLIAKVYNLKKVAAEISIPEKEIADIQIGRKVTLRARAYPGKEFEGTVDSIAVSAQEGSGSGTPISLRASSRNGGGGGSYVVAVSFPVKRDACYPEIAAGMAQVGARSRLPLGTTLYGGNLWSRGSGPADFGLNPVQTTSLSFWDWGETSDRNYRPRVCPGTPLTFFTNWEESQRIRSDLEIDGIRLADYKLNDVLGGANGLGIMQ